LNSNSSLFSIGNSDFKLNHLLIIGILSLSFSTSFLIRSQPAQSGWELNEFDPFFNYRATQYIVDNGIDSYFQWNDDLSWYPHGRNVSQTSQVMLHLTAATTYGIFGGNIDLYTFTILFPVIFGSLTVIAIFALVRIIGGTTAGLFASLLFSISLPIIIRGQIGWFKSEPLGLFFGILAIYLFLSGIKTTNSKISISKLFGGGLFLTLGISAWGGDQFFVIPLGIFFLVLPFLRISYKIPFWSIPLFTVAFIITSLGFEKIGIHFLTGIGGLFLIISTIFFVSCTFIQNKSSKNNKKRNILFFILVVIIICSSFVIINNDSTFSPLPTHRYLNAINPFLTTTDPLVDSVSEHATTTISESFFFHSVLMIFSGLGIWLLLKNSKKSDLITNEMISFSLIFGLIGIYVSSAFVRLEVFASLSIIIFASIALSILLKNLLIIKTEVRNIRNSFLKFSLIFGLIILLVIPLVYPTLNIVSASDTSLTIMNGGSTFNISSNDWLDSMNWLKHNTSEDAVIASWWDYGYWIQTKADRATLVDNSTLSTYKIQQIAKIFLETPEQGWKMLREMGADYFVIFVASQRLPSDFEEEPIYLLGRGGEESKKHWFMKIAEEPIPKYLHSDNMSGTDYFWNETLLGKMIPFSPLVYGNFQTNQQSFSYQPGLTAVYVKDIKFLNHQDEPLKLVYSSPSFDAKKGESMIGIFIYEINKDYVPEN